MAFSNTLKYLREEREITQKELAKACGLSPQCICNLEQGTRNPTGSTIVTLAKFLNVSSDYLLGLEDDFGARVAAPMGDSLTSEELELLSLFRELSPYLKGMTLDAVRSWAKKGTDGERKKI